MTHGTKQMIDKSSLHVVAYTQFGFHLVIVNSR